MPEGEERRVPDEHKAEKTQTYLLLGFTLITGLIVYSYLSDRNSDKERIISALEFRDQRITGLEQTLAKIDDRLRTVEFTQKSAIGERRANQEVIFKEIEILRRRIGELPKR